MKIESLATASVGKPVTKAGVTLFPVYLRQSMPELLTGMNTGITITELPGAQVPTIMINNPNDRPVLVSEGDTLIGGRQNRVVNVSVLVPAKSEVELPVSCVEAGRWGGGQAFSHRGAKAPRRARRIAAASVTRSVLATNTRRSDQGAIWEAIDAELNASGIDARTRAIDELGRRTEFDDRLARAIDELCARGPLPGQCGVVVAHGRRIVAAEVFASDELLTANWEDLVRSFLLEARPDPKGSPSATKALRFLENAAKRIVAITPGIGLGEELRIESEGISGQALVLQGSLIHASAFALAA